MILGVDVDIEFVYSCCVKLYTQLEVKFFIFDLRRSKEKQLTYITLVSNVRLKRGIICYTLLCMP